MHRPENVRVIEPPGVLRIDELRLSDIHSL